MRPSANVDGCVPQTQHFDSRIVVEEEQDLVTEDLGEGLEGASARDRARERERERRGSQSVIILVLYSID